MRTILLYIILFLSVISFGQNYNYLGTYTSNGTPNYLESPGDVIAVSTLELINSSLPETFQVPTYNPHYITSDFDSDIFVAQTTDVYMTFVDEGAGFRNVIGFYTYDLSNPPTTAPADEDVTIIFPNASKLGSGGGLQPGDKVKLGTFSAGTGIGFLLLSNGWNGSQVTYGYWQLYSNPNFNPESDISKRHHNVLIKDETNELIIIGFEDINREHSWCDHDFNDALYYITATTYSDITTTNIVSTESSTDVYSANLGGFESKGDLNGSIAEKGLNRLKTNNEAETRGKQKPLANYAKRNNSDDLAHYFPDSGMFELEEAYISTSFDPVNYSNAIEVFSVDYYLNEERVSAALLTTTEEGIYEHSKHICDRLNGSTLTDVRPVTINDHRLIYSAIERDNGYIEYTISFSVKKGESENEILSFWNIGDYPQGDYLNFQIWGKSMGQLAHMVGYIIDKLKEEKTLIPQENLEAHIPTVFVSSASYKNEKITVDVINKSSTSQIQLNANFRNSEQSDFYNVDQSIGLSGDYYETFELETGFIFDGGLSLTNTNNNTRDNVYMADGTWGIDYDEDKTSVYSYVVNEQVNALDTSVYQMERDVVVSGTTSEVINIFRIPLPGDLSLDTSEFDTVQFAVKNDVPITVSLIIPDLDDWNNKWEYTIPAHSELTNVSIGFNEFSNLSGQNADTIEKIRMVMFSAAGTTDSPSNFDISLSELAFRNSGSLSNDNFTLDSNYVYNYPNPFTDHTVISFPNESEFVNLKVYDVLGRMVTNQDIETLANGNSINFTPNFSSTGIYFYVLKCEDLKEFKGNFVFVK